MPASTWCSISWSRTSGAIPARTKVARIRRLGDVERAGISFSYHSDMPMAPGQPLFLVWAGVNRITNNGNVRGPEQRVSPLAALRAVNLDAAYSLQLVKQVGSIVPGKLANFTILGANPLRVDPVRIKDIPIWGTVQEGRVVPVPRRPGVAAAPVLGPVLAHVTRTTEHAQGDSCTLAHSLAAIAAAALEPSIAPRP